MCSVPAMVVGSTGLNLFSGLAMRSAAQENARQTYKMGLRANQSAEDSFGNQQSALGFRQREDQAIAAQKKLAKTIQGLQARGTARTSGITGITARLILEDSARQTANAKDAIDQTLESVTSQYRRNVQGLVAQRDNRRNQIQSQINQAYNQIPSLSSVILGAASQGLSTFGSVYGNPAFS